MYIRIFIYIYIRIYIYIYIYIYIHTHLHNSPMVSPINITGTPLRMVFQIVIAASVQMRQEVCRRFLGCGHGDLETQQLGVYLDCLNLRSLMLVCLFTFI